MSSGKLLLILAGFAALCWACDDIAQLTFPQRVFYSQVVLYAEVLHHFPDVANGYGPQDVDFVFAAQLKVFCVLKSGPLAIGPVINITGAGDMGLCHKNELRIGQRYVVLLYLRQERLEPNDKEFLATPSRLREAVAVCGVEARKPDYPPSMDPILKREIDNVECPVMPQWQRCTDGSIRIEIPDEIEYDPLGPQAPFDIHPQRPFNEEDQFEEENFGNREGAQFSPVEDPTQPQLITSRQQSQNPFDGLSIRVGTGPEFQNGPIYNDRSQALRPEVPDATVRAGYGLSIHDPDTVSEPEVIDIDARPTNVPRNPKTSSKFKPQPTTKSTTSTTTTTTTRRPSRKPSTLWQTTTTTTTKKPQQNSDVFQLRVSNHPNFVGEFHVTSDDGGKNDLPPPSLPESDVDLGSLQVGGAKTKEFKSYKYRSSSSSILKAGANLFLPLLLIINALL